MAETLSDDELMSLLRSYLGDLEYARVERVLNSLKESVKTEAAAIFAQELAKKDAENVELRSMCDELGTELAVTLQTLLNCEEAINSAKHGVSIAEYERVKKELEEEQHAGKLREERISFLEKENMSIKSAYVDLEDANIAVVEEVRTWKTKHAELEGLVHRLREENHLSKVKEGKKEEALGHDYSVVADADNTQLAALGSKACASRKLVRKRVSDISDSEEITNITGSGYGGNYLTVPASMSPNRESNAVGKKKPDIFQMGQLSERYDSDEDSLKIPTPKRRRASLLVISDSESEDNQDKVPIGKLYKSLSEQAESFIPSKGTSLSSGRLHEPQCKIIDKTSERSASSKRLSSRVGILGPGRSRRMLKYPTARVFEEDKACRPEDTDNSASESEDESLDSFIVDDDTGESESQSSSSDDSDENENRHTFHGYSDDEEEYNSTSALDKVLAKMRRETKSSNWEYEADMLAAFSVDPELCMQAVCALYRMQTTEEQSLKASLSINKRGFSKLDASRGSKVAKFLLDGDSCGPVKKSVRDLEMYDPKGVKFCHKLATKYSKQLFIIYQKLEDPYFRPS